MLWRKEKNLSHWHLKRLNLKLSQLSWNSILPMIHFTSAECLFSIRAYTLSGFLPKRDQCTSLLAAPGLETEDWISIIAVQLPASRWQQTSMYLTEYPHIPLVLLVLKLCFVHRLPKYQTFQCILERSIGMSGPLRPFTQFWGLVRDGQEGG